MVPEVATPNGCEQLPMMGTALDAGVVAAAMLLLLCSTVVTVRRIRYAPRHARTGYGQLMSVSRRGLHRLWWRDATGGSARSPDESLTSASRTNRLGMTFGAAAAASDPTKESTRMSATKPDTAIDNTVGGPGFPLVLRGYDRQLVDSRVSALVEQLEKERQRGDEAERALSQLRLDMTAGRAQLPAWFASLGIEVGEILDQARVAAEKLLAEAGERIQAAIEAAEVEVADRLKAAEEQASTLEQAARERLAEAETERDRIKAEATKAAEELRTRADREAKVVLAEARDQAKLAWQEAARERRLLEADTKRLARSESVV